MPKFNRETCEVCGEPVVDVAKLPKEIQDQVYRPPRDEVRKVNLEFEEPEHFGEDEVE